MSTVSNDSTKRTRTTKASAKGSDGGTVQTRGAGASRSAKWHKRRREIIDTSAKIFARQGFHGTGTVELCEANGLAKGVFYYYFASKEELLEAINDRIMDEMMLGADRVARSGGAPSEQLTQLGTEFLDVLIRFPDHVSVLMRDFPALTGDYAVRFATRRREYEQRVETILRAGIDAGEFRELDVTHAAQAWISSKTYVWRMTDETKPAPFAHTFEDIFVRGIAK